MADTTTRLETLVHEWREWAEHAEQHCDGWEGEWTHTTELLTTAREHMMQYTPDERTLDWIEQCLVIAEETEEFVAFFKTNASAVSEWLIALSQSGEHRVRWQVAVAAGELPDPLRTPIKHLLVDPIPYVRRLARIAEIDHNVRLIRTQVDALAADTDEFNRLVAEKLHTWLTLAPP